VEDRQLPRHDPAGLTRPGLSGLEAWGYRRAAPRSDDPKEGGTPVTRMRARGLGMGFVAAMAAVTVSLLGAPGLAQAQHTLTPIGGDYTTASLQGYARVVMQHATGPTVDLLVVPAAYGTEPSLGQNIQLAVRRTDQLESACQAVLPEYPQFTGCTATLLLVFQRGDAYDSANAAAFEDPQVDGGFFLGGDQDLFMETVADTPLEQAMADAYDRGVVYGGTSAGNAVESHSMIWGFTDSGSQENELEQGSVLVWWADSTDGERGLSFGSDRAIFDQHFYQMGRFGRLLNVIAQSDDHFGGASRVGLGIDRGTGAPVTDDSTVNPLFGASSATVIDDETAGGTHAWEGLDWTLSSRNTLTHVIPVGDFGYDLVTRTPSANGVPVTFTSPGPWTPGLLDQPGAGPLILGGDVSADFTGPVMGEFVQGAQGSGRSLLLLVFAGYGSTGASNHDVQVYRKGVASAGWTGKVRSLVYGQDQLDASLIDRAAGVLFVGGDQSALAGPVGDASFASFVREAVAEAPVVMTDHAMTAAMGDRYTALPDPNKKTLQDQGIDDFFPADTPVEQGLGILAGASFEPRLTADYRWGRLYELSNAEHSTIAFGICDGTAIVLQGSSPTVDGDLSVVSVDGRAGTFGVGTSGALAAFDVLLNTYAPGDAVI
jgi:cyanophycinase